MVSNSEASERWTTPDSLPRPHGRFVVVVGPDGSGKTTTAEALIDAWQGSAAYFHFCPPLRERLDAQPGRDAGPPPPKAPRDGSRPAGWIRLARNLVRFWFAYAVKIRPLVRRGGLVVGDRWAYGYVGQPHGLRFYGPTWLAHLAIAFFPRPDVTVMLTAPPEVIHARKRELSLEEIEAELVRWAGLRYANAVAVDATSSPHEIARLILRDVLDGPPE